MSLRPKLSVGAAVFVLLTTSTLVLGQSPASAATITSFTAADDPDPNAGPDSVLLSWASTGATEAFLFSPGGDGAKVNTTGTKVVATTWGTMHFTLGIKDAAGAWRYKTADTTALNITAPIVSVTSTNPMVVPYFRSPNIDSPLPTQRITWNMNGASKVKIDACPNGANCTPVTTTTDPFLDVTGNTLATRNPDGTFSGLLGPSGQGEVDYKLTGCTARPDTTLFCGEAVTASIRVVPSLTTSTFREYRNHPVYLGHTISWAANGGNWFYVDAPTLGVNNVLTTSTSYAFTATQLNNAGPGLHSIKVKSCKWYGGSIIDCATQQLVRAAAAGNVSDVKPLGTDVWPAGSALPTAVATVGGQATTSPRAGKVVSTCACVGQNVAAGTVLATVETYDYALVQLQLGGGQTWTTKPWTQDFDAGQSSYIQTNTETHAGSWAPGNGTTILPNGDIYQLGEFTTSAVYVSGNTADTRPLPFLRKPIPAASPTTYEVVRPFGYAGKFPSNVSNSQDSTKDANGKIWSTEGWTGGRPEIQTITAPSGTWQLTFAGQTTGNLAPTATGNTVRAALEALSNVDPGEAEVTPTTGPGPFTVTFKGRLAADIPQMAATNATVATTQNGVYSHSRIYRYDPTGTDVDTTIQDDRFCSYNVPGNQNDIMGVTTGGGKVWFMESAWNGLAERRLSWFNPSDPQFGNCAAANTLDFGSLSAPVAVPPGPTFTPDYCVAPATTNCFGRSTLPAALGSPAHLVYDAAENAIWTSTYTWGNPSSLGRYDIATGAWSVFPLPQPNRPMSPSQVASWGGSNTWKLSVSSAGVFVNDMNDGDIIRFDKAYANRNNCTALRAEVQWVYVNATSGTWTLSFLGQTTGAIDSEAPAATVQASLEALPNIDPGDVTVTPDTVNDRYIVAFHGQYEKKDVGQLIATNVSLAGGTASTSVSTPQPGGQNLCMSEVHLPVSSTWQSVPRGTKLYWTAPGAYGGPAAGALSREPYQNETTQFGYVDLSSWGAITTYTGLESLVAPNRADVGSPSYSWFDIDQTSGKIALAESYRDQVLRLVPL